MKMHDIQDKLSFKHMSNLEERKSLVFLIVKLLQIS